MNIIELVKNIVLQFPKINEICNDIHVDFTEAEPTNYGLSSSGDRLLSEDICGNQTRQHNFVLYAVYQSLNDYDRINNSGVLLELSYWLESNVNNQRITVLVGENTLNGYLTLLTCSNGMLFSIPNENFNTGVRYQLNIAAEYIVESEDK